MYHWYTSNKTNVAFIVGRRGKVLCTGPRWQIMNLCWDLNTGENAYDDDDQGLEPPVYYKD